MVPARQRALTAAIGLTPTAMATSASGVQTDETIEDQVEHQLEAARGLPSEVLAENFWYCTIDDPSTLDNVLARFGPDHVLLEVDYPHADSTWPHTQAITHERLGHLDADVVEKLTHRNAEELFRWPAP